MIWSRYEKNFIDTNPTALVDIDIQPFLHTMTANFFSNVLSRKNLPRNAKIKIKRTNRHTQPGDLYFRRP